jgi:hypothetical protein
MYVYSRGGPHTVLAPRPSLIYTGVEINAMLPFVDDLVKEQPDGRLGTLCNANPSTHHTLMLHRTFIH